MASACANITVNKCFKNLLLLLRHWDTFQLRYLFFLVLTLPPYFIQQHSTSLPLLWFFFLSFFLTNPFLVAGIFSAAKGCWSHNSVGQQFTERSLKVTQQVIYNERFIKSSFRTTQIEWHMWIGLSGYRKGFGLVWWVLWHINLCRLFNATSSLYIYIKYIWFGLVRFYGISIFVGYLTPNLILCK